MKQPCGEPENYFKCANYILGSEQLFRFHVNFCWRNTSSGLPLNQPVTSWICQAYVTTQKIWRILTCWNCESKVCLRLNSGRHASFLINCWRYCNVLLFLCSRSDWGLLKFFALMALFANPALKYKSSK